MITIRINGIDFTVNIVDGDSEKLIVDGTARCGSIWYEDAAIHILKTLPPRLMRQCIMHELTHAYICAYGFMRYAKFNNEQLCDFMAAYAKPICYDADAVMKHYGMAEETSEAE